MNTAPVAGTVPIICQPVFRLSAMEAMLPANAISVFVTTAPAMASANCYGERRWMHEADELCPPDIDLPECTYQRAGYSEKATDLHEKAI